MFTHIGAARLVAFLLIAVGAVAAPFASGILDFAIAVMVFIAAMMLYFMPNEAAEAVDQRLPEAMVRQPLAGSQPELITDNREFMRHFGAAAAKTSGTLLVIEVDRLGVVPGMPAEANGESRSLILQAIRQNVRHDDLIGLTADGAFSVFLRGAPQWRSEEIASRICSAVTDTIFFGDREGLEEIAVAVGGIVVTNPMGEDLMARAHESLEQARAQAPNSYVVAAA
ncbi:hypothetical protein VW29_10325 [Devosia limi DSM 17137]|uniref:GGDEF domain-containing protein n=1 Tax=Devosia limi DSM 17137 TaxID=1121477 RepID=A0A0F5LPW3_9HYPH|nr:hypothetical protein [Devosia limi]KKB84358.1 hypothetical protein VW29_10325 [Devosia limi DSM 17137]SHF63099.1 hypothetical protein SAMN02745223_03172 [Devosia limi DSM 17137]